MTLYDELTGLPGRSALNERLKSLDGNFTLAMVDIDHFYWRTRAMRVSSITRASCMPQVRA